MRRTIVPAGLSWLLLSCTAHAAPRIEVLSNRADLVSGGDALVRIANADGSRPSSAEVRVGDRDVSSAFAARPNGAYEGLVTGLAEGENEVTARLADGSASRLTIDNHPIGGPIFAGPQVQPWICNTQSPPANSGTSPTVVPVGLGPPRDAQCNTPAAISYVYKDAGSGSFQPYDPKSPPPDASIATTTTDQDVTVPYVVRQEFGVQDRGIYAIAVLADPKEEWDRWAPQRGWNGKLLIYYGASTAPNHTQSQPSAVLDDKALSRGFMTANSSLNVHGQNSNQNVSAEAVVMLKEHLVERYGPIRYTIGEGCSGGSYQYMQAAMYPGLLDGIQPNCSYTDLWTTAPDVTDCHLILTYFERNPHKPWVPEIDGHKDPSDCAAWEALFANIQDPARASNCKLPPEQVYNAETNPTGTRCDLQDYQVATFGRRPRSDWGPVEKKIGRGFAERPAGNLGIQYGLRALEAGKISAADFADLNAKIGGQDIDNKAQAAREGVDEQTAAIMYRTGQVTDPRQLATVPIIDLRAYTETAEIHTSFYSYKMRARLDEANGGHGNMLIWTFPGSEPILGVAPPKEIAVRSFLLMDRWLADIEADRSDTPLAAKVVRNKPSDAVDTCFTQPASPTPANPAPGAGAEITDPAQCAALYPYYGNTRTAAGSPATDDVIQCRLKPLRRSDYAGVTFTDEQWAQLREAFPTGVCDWSKPGLGEQPSIPWMTLADGPGGRPLGPVPSSRALGSGSGSAPGSGGGAGVPSACAPSAAFRSVRLTAQRGGALRVGFARRAGSPVAVEVLQQSRGRRIGRERLVARFSGVVRPFTWDGEATRRGRAVRDGYYVVKLRARGDTRKIALRRTGGRFRLRPAIERPARCGLLASFRLERPVFGGTAGRRLGIRLRVRDTARVRVTVLRGRRVVARGPARVRRAGVIHRLRLGAGRLPRGDIRVRVTATRDGRSVSSTLTARRL